MKGKMRRGDTGKEVQSKDFIRCATPMVKPASADPLPLDRCFSQKTLF